MKRLPTPVYILIIFAFLLPACGGDGSGTTEQANYDEIWKDPDQPIDDRVADLEASVEMPISSLKGFQRVYLKPGESKAVSFRINEKMLQMVNEEGKFILEPGEFKITIGGSSPGSRSLELGTAEPVEVLLAVN